MALIFLRQAGATPGICSCRSDTKGLATRRSATIMGILICSGIPTIPHNFLNTSLQLMYLVRDRAWQSSRSIIIKFNCQLINLNSNRWSWTLGRDLKSRRVKMNWKVQWMRCRRARHPLLQKQLRLANGKGQSKLIRVASLRKTPLKNNLRMGK